MIRHLVVATRRRAHLITTVAGLVLLPGALVAQAGTMMPVGASTAAPVSALPASPRDLGLDSTPPAPVGPVAAGLRSGVFTAAAPAETTEIASHVQQDRVGLGQNLALIGVGAAAIVAGVLIGDTAGTALTIGGGALALYGLFRFLR